MSETILYLIYLTVWKTESDSSDQISHQCVHVLPPLLITQLSSLDMCVRHEQESTKITVRNLLPHHPVFTLLFVPSALGEEEDTGLILSLASSGRRWC